MQPKEPKIIDPTLPPALLLYRELRRRELVRISQAHPFADKLVRKVLAHPDLEAIIIPKLNEGFRGRAERTRWLAELNATNQFRHRLTWQHLMAYQCWLHHGQPGQEPMPSEMLTSIGAGDKGSSGRRRPIRTPSSQELAQTHGLRVGNRIVPLYLLHRIVEQAPETDRPLLRRLCGGLARQLPEQPEPEMLEAIEFLANQLPWSKRLDYR